MFEKDPVTNKIDFSHNPFSMPQGGMKSLIEKDPLDALLAWQFDIVCNGIELSSGAIRNHKRDLMIKLLKLQVITKMILRHDSAHCFAFKFGPSTRRVCTGIDRMVMLIAGEENLRRLLLSNESTSRGFADGITERC